MIYFLYRALTKCEGNYSTYGRSIGTVVSATKKLKQYLLGNHIILRSDYKSLICVFGGKKRL